MTAIGPVARSGIRGYDRDGGAGRDRGGPGARESSRLAAKPATSQKLKETAAGIPGLFVIFFSGLSGGGGAKSGHLAEHWGVAC